MFFHFGQSSVSSPFYGGAPASQALFRSIVQTANGTPAEAVRFAIDGDSQETCPGGQGIEYVTLLNYELWKHFRNVPETQIMGIGSYGGTPRAAVCMQGASNGGAAAGDTPTARYPYNMQPSANNRYNTSVSQGQSAVLQANMLNTATSLTEIDRATEYLSRTGLKFNVLLPFISTQGDTLRIRHTLSSNGASNYFTTTQLTETFDITSAQLDVNAWLKITTNYNFGSGNDPNSSNLLTQYPQCVVVSNNTTNVEVGNYWFSSRNTRGIIVSSFCTGGLVTTNQFADRPDCLPFIQTYAPSVMVLACMANDAGSGGGITAAQFKTNVINKINTYLAANPNFVFLLMSDPDRTSLTAGQFTEFDAMPEKLREVANDPQYRAVFFDRKGILAAKYDWQRSSGTINSYLIDSVHYSTAGARLAAYETAYFIRAMGGLI